MTAGKRGASRTPVISAAAVAVLLSVAVGACGGDAAEARQRDGPAELAIFVYDRSGSVASHQLDQAGMLTGQRVAELGHGDRIVALQLLESSLAEPRRRWSQIVPDREYPGRRVASDSLARERFLRDARQYMERFTDTTTREPVNGTDVLSTLHDVSAELQANPEHVTTLYLFSDMLQANRRLDFEKPGVRPPEGWVERADMEGTLPDLEGLCVVVVGARVDTEAGQAVREFWQSYFETTGAELRPENYLYRAVRLPSRPCRRSPAGAVTTAEEGW